MGNKSRVVVIGYDNAGYAFSAAIDVKCVVYGVSVARFVVSGGLLYPALRYLAVDRALFVQPQSY